MNSIVLDVNEVRARYGKREILTGVSLRVPAGEWFCLLGPNGVGKSSLLRCISGGLALSGGDIRIANHSVLSDARAAKRELGYACAPETLPGLLTGEQCLEVYAQAKGLQTLEDDVLQLATALKFTPYLQRFVDTYSLGTRQKLCILLALLGAPQVIVLDESLNGLDPSSALVIKRYLQQRLSAGRCGVLLATHSLDVVEHYADKAALLMDGRIVRQWDEAEIAKIRSESAGQAVSAMEAALAAAAEQAQPVETRAPPR